MNLVALAERFIHLSSEIEDVRRAMLVCLSNGLDHDEPSAPGRPFASKPNGRDPHPPLALRDRDVATNVATNVAPDARNGKGAATNGAAGARRSLAPYAGKARRGKSPTSAAYAEQRLLTAMQEHSGASVDALAKAAGANRSSTGERLRGLASRGVVTKDSAGHWRLVADLAGEAAGPTQPPAG